MGLLFKRWQSQSTRYPILARISVRSSSLMDAIARKRVRRGAGRPSRRTGYPASAAVDIPRFMTLRMAKLDWRRATPGNRDKCWL